MGDASERVPLAEAEEAARKALKFLNERTAGYMFAVAGSVRRKLPTVGDLDIVAIGDRGPCFPWGGWMGGYERQPIDPRYDTHTASSLVRATLAAEGFGGTRAWAVDLRFAHTSQAGALLTWLTGPREWNQNLVERAAARGWEFCGAGLYVADTGRRAGVMEARSELELLRALIGEWVPPEDRE